MEGYRCNPNRLNEMCIGRRVSYMETNNKIKEIKSLWEAAKSRILSEGMKPLAVKTIPSQHRENIQRTMGNQPRSSDAPNTSHTI